MIIDRVETCGISFDQRQERLIFKCGPEHISLDVVLFLHHRLCSSDVIACKLSVDIDVSIALCFNDKIIERARLQCSFSIRQLEACFNEFFCVKESIHIDLINNCWFFWL